MNIENKMPESGQFVAVWEYAGEMWSYTMRVQDGELQVYQDEVYEEEIGVIGDEWVKYNGMFTADDGPLPDNAVFITA